MTAAELARRDGHEAIATLIEEHEHRLAQRNIKPALRAPRLPASPPEEPAQPDDASQVTGQQLIIFQFDQQLDEHEPEAGEIDALQPMVTNLLFLCPSECLANWRFGRTRGCNQLMNTPSSNVHPMSRQPSSVEHLWWSWIWGDWTSNYQTDLVPMMWVSAF
eukprot:m.41570 g.41570  ORF g.41570 m.41570 type:complete len:162 (-) comp46198_c0_seq1:84-569(-)